MIVKHIDILRATNEEKVIAYNSIYSKSDSTIQFIVELCIESLRCPYELN